MASQVKTIIKKELFDELIIILLDSPTPEKSADLLATSNRSRVAIFAQGILDSPPSRDVVSPLGWYDLRKWIHEALYDLALITSNTELVALLGFPYALDWPSRVIQAHERVTHYQMLSTLNKHLKQTDLTNLPTEIPVLLDNLHQPIQIVSEDKLTAHLKMSIANDRHHLFNYLLRFDFYIEMMKSGQYWIPTNSGYEILPLEKKQNDEFIKVTPLQHILLNQAWGCLGVLAGSPAPTSSVTSTTTVPLATSTPPPPPMTVLPTTDLSISSQVALMHPHIQGFVKSHLWRMYSRDDIEMFSWIYPLLGGDGAFWDETHWEHVDSDPIYTAIDFNAIKIGQFLVSQGCPVKIIHPGRPRFEFLAGDGTEAIAVPISTKDSILHYAIISSQARNDVKLIKTLDWVLGLDGVKELAAMNGDEDGKLHVVGSPEIKVLNHPLLLSIERCRLDIAKHLYHNHGLRLDSKHDTLSLSELILLNPFSSHDVISWLISAIPPSDHGVVPIDPLAPFTWTLKADDTMSEVLYFRSRNADDFLYEAYLGQDIVLTPLHFASITCYRGLLEVLLNYQPGHLGPASPQRNLLLTFSPPPSPNALVNDEGEITPTKGISSKQTPIMLCCSIGGNDKAGDMSDIGHSLTEDPEYYARTETNHVLVMGSGGICIRMMIESFIDDLVNGEAQNNHHLCHL